MSWLTRNELQREYPNSLGASVERLVPLVGCPYCGARPYQRCRTKSGNIDPLYHSDRQWAASDLYDTGVRVEPYWSRASQIKRQRRAPRPRTLAPEMPMLRRMERA